MRTGRDAARAQRFWGGVIVALSLLWLAGCGQGGGAGGQSGANQGGASQGGANQGSAPGGGGQPAQSGGDRFDTGQNCPPGFIFVPQDTYIFSRTAEVRASATGFTHQCDVMLLTADVPRGEVREYHKAQLTAAGFALQDGADNEEELTFVGDGATLNLIVRGEDELTEIRYGWTAAFPNGAALAEAVAGPPTLTAGDSGPIECLPYGALVPSEARDVEIGAFLTACHGAFVVSGEPAAVISFYQRILTQSPFELELYVLEFEPARDAFVPYSAEFYLEAPELGMDTITITVAPSDDEAGAVAVEMSWNNARN